MKVKTKLDKVMEEFEDYDLTQFHLDRIRQALVGFGLAAMHDSEIQKELQNELNQEVRP